MSSIASAVSVSRPELGRRVIENWFSAERQLPAPRRVVLYQTATTQQLGYLDEGNRWRRLNGQTETEPVVSWVAKKGFVGTRVEPKTHAASDLNRGDTYLQSISGKAAAVEESSEDTP
jgi:hypothetical protein